MTSTCDKGRKVDNAKGKQSTQTKKLTSTCDNSRKVGGTEAKSNSNAHEGRKINNNEARSHAYQKSKDVMQGQSHADQRSTDVMQNQSHADQKSKDMMQKQPHADRKSKDMMKSSSGQKVKLSAKARQALSQDRLTSGKKPEVENLILHLTDLLNSWDADKRGGKLQAEEHVTHLGNDPKLDQRESPNEEDPMVLLATKINSVNASNYDQFVYATQFDTEKPETYGRAMQALHATRWAKAMEEELDQLYKNKTWTPIPDSEMKPGHQALGGKWVYKMKRDVDGNIACFKAR